jgi:transcriptional regulator with PAS, ATPase and Fis domain
MARRRELVRFRRLRRLHHASGTRMSNSRTTASRPADRRAWSATLASIRARRDSEDAEGLLEEALALLDALIGTAAVASPSQGSASGVVDPIPEVDGDSPLIRQLKGHIRRAAHDSDVTVLILGESGTGKERVARAVHRLSPRSRRPFIVVNCAGLAPTLVEDELFGHVRGAFTGAVDNRAGPFERANGGTVMLDEVGELTPDLQMKLLRALQERTVQRLGGRHEAAFDVRVIAATNVDLARATAQGRFRPDLYYRLNVYALEVPPLRARGAADIRSLASAMLARLAERRGRMPPALSRDVLERFGRHAWPGNVRELENTLEYMIVQAGDVPLLTSWHLPPDFGAAPRNRAATGRTIVSLMDHERVLPSAEVVRSVLEQHGARRDRAAAELGLSRHQLYRLLKRYGAPGGDEER